MNTIYVSVRPEETRMGTVEDDQLRDYAVERRSTDNLVGNVYRGRVSNVVPGIQAAFVDMGTGKNGFLTLKKGEKLWEGQMLLVQVVKDARGNIVCFVLLPRPSGGRPCASLVLILPDSPRRSGAPASSRYVFNTPIATPGQDLIFCRKCGNINTEKVQKNSPGRAFSAPRRVIFLFYLPSSSRTALRNPAASRSMRRSSSRRFPW